MLGKLGVFFLSQACLDYPAAVGRVVFFHGLQLLSWVDFSSGASRKKAGLGWQPQQDSPELLKTHFVDFAYPANLMGIPSALRSGPR
jgi:hypothetical protein